MLVSQWGLLDSLWSAVTGADGPLFLVSRGLAMSSNIVAYIWKWLPFWTLIFLGARMAIPREIYEAAAIDGATAIQQTVHVTFPLMANVYLVATLLSTLWTLGDFSTVHFVSVGCARAHHGRAGNLRLSRGVQLRPSGAGGGGDDVGFAARHPHRDPLDAASAQDRRATMTGRPANEPNAAWPPRSHRAPSLSPWTATCRRHRRCGPGRRTADLDAAAGLQHGAHCAR